MCTEINCKNISGAGPLVSPVEPNGEHPVLPERPDKEVNIAAASLPVLHQGAVTQGNLTDPGNRERGLRVRRTHGLLATHLHLFLFSRVSLVL